MFKGPFDFLLVLLQGTYNNLIIYKSLNRTKNIAYPFCIFKDVSDHELTCVGFWMEDYKSYLITWDQEDAISNFRCWVGKYFTMLM